MGYGSYSSGYVENGRKVATTRKRTIKERIFERRAKEPKQFVENKQYKQLGHWMMQRYEEKVALKFQK
ncbi:hypothetical protein [Paenibacillus sp. BJ-4]|uniref:hypothetical protein n=1 Tax=Paenibacillus sp. BJ-4 TaxID=2878097 RepID=UPI001CF08682|nr:hypothetical protein [Paenibacillus sp. BJ-4]